MLNIADLCLGVFLVLCGFVLSLFNLRRVVKRGTAFSSVLFSENVILMCIGIAYVSRSVYSLNPTNVEDIFVMEERAGDFASIATKDNHNCGFPTLLLSYGPLVVSMINSFLALVINNYMHYKIIKNLKKKNDQIDVEEFSEKTITSNLWNIANKYLSLVMIALQWIMPILIAFAMYPISVKEISLSQARKMDGSCMAMLDLTQNGCTNITQYAMDIPKYIQSPVNFLEIQENEININNTDQLDTVLRNIMKIIKNFNITTNVTQTVLKLPRRPKMSENCMKMCYTDNKSLLLYMFILGCVSYFIPITVSTIILTKIHIMEVTEQKMKISAKRDLLYNVLFWTPVMFDTFLSLILCSYSMHGLRASMLNVVANIYQVVKNFMNTKYIKENIIVPT